MTDSASLRTFASRAVRSASNLAGAAELAANACSTLLTYGASLSYDFLGVTSISLSSVFRGCAT